jgi:hypothetical protein
MRSYRGVYRSYFAGILKHVEEINFYVLCNEDLTYSEYIEKAISSDFIWENNKHPDMSC